MKDFKIALVQQDSPVMDKKGNLAKTASRIRQAAEAGVQLACFPELNITGHAGHPAMVREAEPVPGGPAVEFLSRLAHELRLHICAGIAEDDRGIHYNTQFLVGPDGYIGKQRKTHLSADEYFYFRHGTALPVFDLPFARLGIIICYDNLLPEIARCLAVQGVELLLCPHAARIGDWPRTLPGRRRAVAQTKEQWTLTHRSRALDNGCYVALCNAAGRSALKLDGVKANHAGGCMVFDPEGRLLKESTAKDIREEMIVVSLKGARVAETRSGKCFNLKTRRPEVFRMLTEPTA